MSGGIEKRVFMHYKSLKHSSPLEFVVTKRCGWMNICGDDPYWRFFPHSHGYNKTTTSNDVWLRLARTHKMSVREVKDIVTKMRGK